MPKQFLKISLYIIISIVFAQPALAAERLPVFVSIVPQKFFVQQIGKDLVDVQVMVQPGASPATYEPKPRQMAALTKSKVYFAIGVPFENAWLPKLAVANPAMRVVHTDSGITRIRMAANHDHEDIPERHAADEQNESRRGHTGLDPHIWLSPPLVKVQARSILAGLQEIDPVNKDVYAANFKQFSAEIDQLDAELRKVFAGKVGMRFMVFHPSWGYFARAYALKQVPIEIEGKNPKPSQLKRLIEHARENRIKVIFAQPQFSTRSAALLAREIGGQVAFADPLALDWMANLRNVANKFKLALK
jgi:zinc transport system substrate-binding protein